MEELKATCTILNVTKDLVGFYSCKAVNDVNEEKTTAKLDLASSAVGAPKLPQQKISTSETTTTTTTTSSANSESLSESMTSSTVTETSKLKSQRKVKSQKKVARTQKTAKEESKTELKVLTQTQQISEDEYETDEMQTQTGTINKAYLEVVRDEMQDESVSDRSSITKVTTKNQRFEDTDVEILEETEEIHVKIYKEVFSIEEMENFKVADEVNQILESIEAQQFGSGERPLREIATVAHLLKKGVEICEIIQLYDADFFPALKLPESQAALVQLVERQGYENLIAEILHNTTTDDENLLASTVGFRAFMRMVEVTKTPIEQIITNFKFEDFVSQEWKHKEIKDNEIVEVTESHVSSVRAEKISIIGNEFDDD